MLQHINKTNQTHTKKQKGRIKYFQICNGLYRMKNKNNKKENLIHQQFR